MDATRMYISCLKGMLNIWTFISLYQLRSVASKGTNPVDPQPDTSTRIYPSQETDNFYYPYYSQYITASGFAYKKNHLDSPRTVSKCKNYDPYLTNNGSTLGEFPCPMERDPGEFTHCCGESNYEYCCKAIDNVSVRLAIGLGTTAAVGIIIFIIICAYLKFKHTRKTLERKQSGRNKRNELGIREYETVKTKGYTAEQTENGYRIMVSFARNGRFYREFWEKLQAKYPHAGWKMSHHNTRKEGKISFQDGNWVSFTLSDDVDGRPAMVVGREKHAIDWMENEFEEIANTIADDGGCSCFSRSSKATSQVQPATARPQGQDDSYELEHGDRRSEQSEN